MHHSLPSTSGRGATAQATLKLRRHVPAARMGVRASQPGSDRLASTSTVDSILRQIEGSDGGMALSDSAKASVDSDLDDLEAAGKGSQPLNNPMLYGNFTVAYTSIRRATEQRGQPSGGRFRSPLGRLLFATSGLFQSVLPGPDPGSPPLVINKVAFKLFGIIPGAIGLRGKAFPMGADQDTVNVLFDPPVLSLGNVHLRLGPPSSVVLTTTYVDERVRLGKGSRGSLFVFTRSAEADAAEMEKVGTQRSGVSGLLAIAALFAALAGGGAACWAAGASALKGAAVALWLLALLTGAVLWRGGIVQDDQDEAALQQARRREAQQAGNNAAVSGTATVAAAAGGSG